MDDLKEEEEIINKKREKKEKNLNSQRLKKLLKEKNVTNDFSYFKNMKIKEQKNILKNLVEINKVSTIKKPYKIALIETNIKPEIKAIAMKKVNLLTMMDPSTGDYYKNKLWVDTFMNIPFGKYASLPIKLSDGLEKSQQFMKNAKNILDKSVYGLNDAKMQIMQMIGGWISNPNAVGTAIAIQGPMGTGKTTLVKEGISKILNRPFAFIPLGGATDSSYLEGHSYTYEGSIWGKIVDTIINCKCMNPVFYFDELDKVSNTPKGEEIIGILTHLTDTTQNSQFHDKYFSNLDFDLSKALFIFSYNHENKVNAILKDRMYQIKTKGYDKKDKNIIAKDYLIKSIEKNINFKEGEVTFAEGVFEHIIEKLTAKEKGVRNFKRCLEIIYSKLNLFRLMEKDTTLFEKDEFINVEFPFEVTIEIVDKLIKQNDKDAIPFGMYM
jgi:ATP-dependent Lon protease